MSKKMSAYKICTFTLCIILIYSINTTPLFALENKAPATHNHDGDAANIKITQDTISPAPDKKNESHLIWVIGEIALAVITAVILLIIYSWHLRTVVSKKTQELRKLNARLEDKVEERTAKLKKSKEAYKTMYAHAENERKRTKVALESEREAIKQNLNFMDMISHEYRTPLSVISSSIELIKKKCELNNFRQLDEQIRKMTISTQRLIDIFESSLGKDRLDNLAPQLQMVTLNLVHIISTAIQLTKTVYADYQIIFKNEPGDIQITGDEELLVTVFKNILDNACKYSAPEEPIYIMVTSDQAHVEVQTLDSGIGIDEDEIRFVFEKYFRSEHTGKRQGAGIGLFLVKTIVDLHNGDVKLASERNIGTNMSVCLPR